MLKYILRYFKILRYNKKKKKAFFCQSNMNIEYIGL